MSDYHSLSYFEVGIAVALMLVNAAVSLAFRLDLEKTILWASTRAIAQLLLIGMVLQWVFDLQQTMAVLGITALMTFVAAITAVGRQQIRYDRMYLDTLLAIGGSAWLIGAYGSAWVVNAQPWYQPKLFIPLLGMILGNSLNGITLGLHQITDAMKARPELIEMRLTLGANRWEACLPEMRNAIRAGMIPIVNSMMVVGLVSLPGMMTGQLLSGVDPVEAVKYQIAILFLIAAATCFGTVTSVVMATSRLLGPAHRLETSRFR